MFSSVASSAVSSNVEFKAADCLSVPMNFRNVIRSGLSTETPALDVFMPPADAAGAPLLRQFLPVLAYFCPIPKKVNSLPKLLKGNNLIVILSA